jgi:hypothetical protein
VCAQCGLAFGADHNDQGWQADQDLLARFGIDSQVGRDVEQIGIGRAVALNDEARLRRGLRAVIGRIYPDVCL